MHAEDARFITEESIFQRIQEDAENGRFETVLHSSDITKEILDEIKALGYAIYIDDNILKINWKYRAAGGKVIEEGEII